MFNLLDQAKKLFQNISPSPSKTLWSFERNVPISLLISLQQDNDNDLSIRA